MTRIISPPVRIVAGEPTAPQWVLDAISAGWQQGEWIPISGDSPGYGLEPTNTMTDVKSTPVRGGVFQDIIRAWCGGTYAAGYGTHGTYIIGLGGGHNSYDGNDVFGFDLVDRLWRELVPDTGIGKEGNEYGEFEDGTPLPYHTMSWLEYLPDQNAFFTPMGVSHTSGQTPDVATPYPHLLNLGTKQWTRGAPVTSVTSKEGWRRPNSGCYVPSIGKYVGHCLHVSSSADSFLSAYDPAADEWDEHPGFPFSSSSHFNAMAHEPVNDRVMLADFRALDVVRYKQATDLSGPTTTVTQTGDIPNLVSGQGWHWSPAKQAMIYYANGLGPNVYALHHVAGSTYEWENLAHAEAAFAPPDSQNGWYNRLRVASVGDGIDLLIGCRHVDGPVYAFRVT